MLYLQPSYGHKVINNHWVKSHATSTREIYWHKSKSIFSCVRGLLLQHTLHTHVWLWICILMLQWRWLEPLWLESPFQGLFAEVFMSRKVREVATFVGLLSLVMATLHLRTTNPLAQSQLQLVSIRRTTARTFNGSARVQQPETDPQSYHSIYSIMPDVATCRPD